MMSFLSYFWQLPQNLLGLLLLLFWKPEKKLEYKGVKIFINSKFPSGVSLGQYVILGKYPYNTPTWNSVKHEYGHHLQSLRYGWLYLIVTGLPSLLGNVYGRIFRKGSAWYYSQPWEKGADKLGGADIDAQGKRAS